MFLLTLPFLFQGAAMFFDEFYFHRKRGLGLWERIGHPVDTFSVFLCYAYLLNFDFSLSHLNIFIGLCLFSCLLITKDEFIHTEVCVAQENWLHSLLFVLHPICFLCAGVFWWQGVNLDFLKIQTAIVLVFMAYQILFWSVQWKRN